MHNTFIHVWELSGWGCINNYLHALIKQGNRGSGIYGNSRSCSTWLIYVKRKDTDQTAHQTALMRLANYAASLFTYLRLSKQFPRYACRLLCVFYHTQQYCPLRVHVSVCKMSDSQRCPAKFKINIKC